MRYTTKRTVLNTTNAQKIEDLCNWIIENCENTIGWTQLTHHSGFQHKQLIELFLLYKHKTPMTFIRQVRQKKNISTTSNLQFELFEASDKIQITTKGEEGCTKK
jgi:transcriptional regulator GlxA family with amidase domain